MKICLYIAFDERPEIAPFVKKGLRALVEACPYEIDVMAVFDYDADHEFIMDWVSLTAGHTFGPTDPLGEKLNNGVGLFLDHFIKYDYLMQMGCDDIIDTDYWDYVAPYIEERHPMFGLSKIRFLDWESKEEIICNHFPMVFGAGRMIRMDLVRETYETLGYVWDNERTSGLDYSSEQNIVRTCGLWQEINCAERIGEDRVLITDIKTGKNINSFEQMRKFKSV